MEAAKSVFKNINKNEIDKSFITETFGYEEGKCELQDIFVKLFQNNVFELSEYFPIWKSLSEKFSAEKRQLFYLLLIEFYAEGCLNRDYGEFESLGKLFEALLDAISTSPAEL